MTLVFPVYPSTLPHPPPCPCSLGWPLHCPTEIFYPCSPTGVVTWATRLTLGVSRVLEFFTCSRNLDVSIHFFPPSPPHSLFSLSPSSGFICRAFFIVRLFLGLVPAKTQGLGFPLYSFFSTPHSYSLFEFRRELPSTSSRETRLLH